DARETSYGVPHSEIIDVSAIGGPASEVNLRVNTNPLINATGNAAIIKGSAWSLGSRNGGSSSPYDGVIWGTILVAEEPDATKWEIGARQWMSNHNMGGILDV